VRLIAVFSIAALVALAGETILPRWLPLGPLMPDLVLILAVDLGLKHHGALAVLMVFAMGYATDSFSGTHLGLNAFVLTVIYLMAYGLSRYLISSSAAIGAIVVFIGVVLSGMANYLVSESGESLASARTIVPALLVRASVSAVVAPGVFGLMAAVKRRIGLRPRSVRE
jgi:rod shape-determining protein MreD